MFKRVKSIEWYEYVCDISKVSKKWWDGLREGKGSEARGSKTWGEDRPFGAKRYNKPQTRRSAVTLHSLSKQKRKAIRLTLNALITLLAKHNY